MKRMAASAGLSGGKNKSFSSKNNGYMSTKNSVPETQIIQLTGHKNLQSLIAIKKALLQTAKGNVSCLELIQKA